MSMTRAPPLKVFYLVCVAPSLFHFHLSSGVSLENGCHYGFTDRGDSPSLPIYLKNPFLPVHRPFFCTGCTKRRWPFDVYSVLHFGLLVGMLSGSIVAVVPLTFTMKHVDHQFCQHIEACVGSCITEAGLCLSLLPIHYPYDNAKTRISWESACVLVPSHSAKSTFYL